MKVVLGPAWFPVLCLGLAACGDALTDLRYQGEAKMVLNGTIQSLNAVAEISPTLVRVTWTRPNWDGRAFFGGAAVENQITPVTDTSFPARFAVAIYDDVAPNASVDLSRIFAAQGAQGVVSLGRVGVFDDVDRDGVFDPGGPDIERGTSVGHSLLYARGLNGAGRKMLQALAVLGNPGDLRDGFNLLQQDFDGQGCAALARVESAGEITIVSTATVERALAARSSGACVCAEGRCNIFSSNVPQSRAPGAYLPEDVPEDGNGGTADATEQWPVDSSVFAGVGGHPWASGP